MGHFLKGHIFHSTMHRGLWYTDYTVLYVGKKDFGLKMYKFYSCSLHWKVLSAVIQFILFFRGGRPVSGLAGNGCIYNSTFIQLARQTFDGLEKCTDNHLGKKRPYMQSKATF